MSAPLVGRAAWANRFQGLWRHPDFMKLWAGQTVSELGSRITRDGLPLAAVLVLGATPAQMGLLSAAGGLPVLLVGLAAGVWVDRLPRRPILIAADLARALILLSIPLAAVLGRLSMLQLYAVIALTGLFTVFFGVAYEAYLPALVSRQHLLEGNSKLALSDSLAEVLGPGLAGTLVQVVTAPIAILLDSLSFLVSAVALLWIRRPEQRQAPEAQPHMLREIREGVGVVWHNPILRAFALSVATRSFFGNFFGVLYALFAIRELGLGPAALGLTIAMGGAGDLGGALFAGRVVRRFGLGPSLVGTLALGTLFSLLIPAAGGSVLLAVLMLSAAQLFGDGLRTVYTINEVSLRQAITPDRLLGRANASMQFMAAGIGPLGALVGGLLGTAIGLRPTLVIAALGSGLLGSLWLLFSPLRVLREHPPAVE